jgi:hypothetical protein
MNSPDFTNEIKSPVMMFRLNILFRPVNSIAVDTALNVEFRLSP